MAVNVSAAHEPLELHVQYRQEDGVLWATVHDFPGVFATGDDLDALRESLEEGISLVLAGPGEKPPQVKLEPLRIKPVRAASSVLTYA